MRHVTKSNIKTGCTQKILNALVYLKNDNKFYSNAQINMGNLPPEL